MLMTEHDGASLPSYDQDLWEQLENLARDVEKSLQLFRLLRESNLQMLDRLTLSSGSAWHPR